MVNVLSKANYRELLLWLFRRRKRFRVTGNSMLPLLHSGEEILMAPHAYDKSLPKIDDVVVMVHPQHSTLTIVKRVTAVDRDGNCFLTGDNLTQSTDSRHWGTVKYTNIMGKVTSRFS